MLTDWLPRKGERWVDYLKRCTLCRHFWVSEASLTDARREVLREMEDSDKQVNNGQGVNRIHELAKELNIAVESLDHIGEESSRE